MECQQLREQLDEEAEAKSELQRLVWDMFQQLIFIIFRFIFLCKYNFKFHESLIPKRNGSLQLDTYHYNSCLQVSKANAEVTQWRARFEGEGMVRQEELEEARLCFDSFGI